MFSVWLRIYLMLLLSMNFILIYRHWRPRKNWRTYSWTELRKTERPLASSFRQFWRNFTKPRILTLRRMIYLMAFSSWPLTQGRQLAPLRSVSFAISRNIHVSSKNFETSCRALTSWHPQKKTTTMLLISSQRS